MKTDNEKGKIIMELTVQQKNKIAYKMKNFEYFSRNNIPENIFRKDLYDPLTNLRETLLKREAGDTHIFNKGNVTGLWLLTKMTYDGNPQLIMRSPVKSGTIDRLILNGEINGIVYQDVIYDYDTSVLGGTQPISGEQEELLEEIEKGNILTIYDKERES
jgi:hypothetical protein